MQIKLTKKGDFLLPFDKEAKDVISKWKEGDFILCEAKRPRNYGHHKKYYALINTILNNTEIFSDIKEAETYFKIKAGIYKTIKVGDKFYPMVGSINFAQMNQDEFNVFYDKAVQEALNILPVENSELANLIARF